MKLISWNIARRDGAWRSLLDTDADIALVQEASPPPVDVAGRISIDSIPWQTSGGGMNRPWRTAVVGLSDRIEVEWFEPKSLAEAYPGEFGVSRPGTLAVAQVTAPDEEPIIVASLYAPWEEPHASTGSSWIYSDGSVHRVISDLSAFIGRQAGHRIIAAGDLNSLYGYGENGNPYWASRYATVFERMAGLGLEFVGPQVPAGRQAEPWPNELPPESENVPTFHTNHQTPATATRQLDFVFASRGLADKVQVRALNQVEDWGPSDHCRVEIEVP